MAYVFSGTWTATLTRSGIQTKLIFSPTDSTVQAQPVGADPKNYMSGIWTVDNNGNFVIQVIPPPGWNYPYNYIWYGAFQSNTSATGSHVVYDIQRRLAGVDAATFSQG